MRFWRISNHADLNGEGGRVVSGRWHSRGAPIVYLADHPALALVENLVHLEIDVDDLPQTYQLMTIEIPDDVEVAEITLDALARTDPDWPTKPEVTRMEGSAWLCAGRTALLRVPSVILPDATNVLFNPAHPEAARASIVSIRQPPYDTRLFRMGR
jgi:RES domain-containing protein